MQHLCAILKNISSRKEKVVQPNMKLLCSTYNKQSVFHFALLNHVRLLDCQVSMKFWTPQELPFNAVLVFPLGWNAYCYGRHDFRHVSPRTWNPKTSYCLCLEEFKFNPIPHGIWNNVSTWVFSALRLPKAQNLVSDKYFDFFLSIDTKNSPLSDILFALRAVEWQS